MSHGGGLLQGAFIVWLLQREYPLPPLLLWYGLVGVLDYGRFRVWGSLWRLEFPPNSGERDQRRALLISLVCGGIIWGLPGLLFFPSAIAEPANIGLGRSKGIRSMALEVLGGLTVTVCDSGTAALAALSTAQPDLILLDVMMPGMDGPTLLAHLQALPGGLPAPVIFLTAKAMPEEIAQLKALGVIAVLAKPFDPMTLTDQLQSHWQQYQQSAGRSAD